MITFDIKTIKNRSLGKVMITEIQKWRNGKQYYDVEYKDKYTIHKARVLQKREDGVLTLIYKATKAAEKARREFYAFPHEKVRVIANRGRGGVCIYQEEDMNGVKSSSSFSFYRMIYAIMPEDIPERYSEIVMKWMFGQGCPVIDDKLAIYLSDFNRWRKLQFLEEV